MNTDFVQSIQIISSIATPLIVLFLGLKINKTLDVYRSTLAKDKEWRTAWAERFYSTAIEFNSHIEDCIGCLYDLQEIDKQKLPGWEDRFNKKLNRIHDIVENIRRAEWSLKTTVEFAPQSKEIVLKESEQIISLMSNLLAKKQGDLEAIRNALFKFNQAAMMAHREIMG